MTKDADQLDGFDAIPDRALTWRKKYSDLPVVLLVLSWLKQFLRSTSFRTDEARKLNKLKRRGDQLGRLRTLFVAAEAIGHLPPGTNSDLPERVREELGVVIEMGTSLHKVRALRAMRFIASEACIPYLETCLRDRSPWVQANALHTLFKLNLRHSRPRTVLVRFLLGNFNSRLSGSSWSDFKRNLRLDSGLFAGLLRQPGGRSNAFLVLVLCLASILWILLKLSFFTVATIASLPVVIVGLPVLMRRVGTKRRNWWRPLAFGLMDYCVLGLMFFLTWSTPPVGSLLVYGVCLFFTALLNDHRPNLAENLRHALRSILFIVVACVAYIYPSDHVPSTLPMLVSIGAGIHALFFLTKGWHELTEEDKAALRIVRDAVFEVGSSLGRHIRLAAESLGRSLRHNTKWWAIFTLKILVLISALILITNLAKKYQLEPGVQAQASVMFESAKPFLLLILGTILLILYCVITIIILVLFWDEGSIVERLRFRALAGRYTHFKSINDFLAFAVKAVKDESNSVGLRARAALSLAQVPIASSAYIERLMDLAEGDLPTRIQDALFHTIDAAEKRVQRGQADSVVFDIEIINKEITPLLRPGAILKSMLRRLLIVIWVFAVIVGASMLFPRGENSFVTLVAFAEWLFGLLLLLAYVLSMGYESKFRKISLMAALGLLGIAVLHPLQPYLVQLFAPRVFFNFGQPFIDFGTIVSVWLPVVTCLMGVQLAHTIYLVDTDTVLPEVVSGRGEPRDKIVLRFRRSRRQIVTLLSALLFASVAAIVQAKPAQEFFELAHEPMPVFSGRQNSPLVVLEGLPTDGRVVRVALVIQDTDRWPSIRDTFPRAADFQRDLDPNALVRFEGECLGEIWIGSENGSIKAAQVMPMSCLGAPQIREHDALFYLDARCAFGSPVRLVANIYDRTRSEAIVRRATRQNLFSESVSRLDNDRLLEDTLSPFVRTIWSQPYYVSPMGDSEEPRQ